MNLIYINIFIDKLQICIINYINNERKNIKNEEMIIPTSLTIGEKLNYIKKIVSTITEQNNIRAYNINIDNDIGIEIIEAVKIEGILEELFSCKGVKKWR